MYNITIFSILITISFLSLNLSGHLPSLHHVFRGKITIPRKLSGGLKVLEFFWLHSTIPRLPGSRRGG